MITHRDNLPEQIPGYEKALARTQEVEMGAQSLKAVVCAEFESVWGQPEEARPAASDHPLHGAGTVIDRTFLESQYLQLANDEAVSEAQRRVMEAIDEFSA